MPNYFLFYRKSDPNQTPIDFVIIDEELCKFLNVECDAKKYYSGWYDFIGDLLCFGKSLEEIKNFCIKTAGEVTDRDEIEFWIQRIQILNWFLDNFGSKSGWTPKSHMTIQNM